ncbi:uncharacterized protein EAE98_000942 [Botrytis deweyae]|uniref:Uncharacterized protein n=1 Tax=Botrytis deweyae TaxID=2478750 RepID=A0ABQ7J026_9HELO|nr:uncharacterized protein EAE98_000942 [Botrytis deweyae]KAF7938604.1 hypothetical protein EAE98_000942 [Botrytis deweyae]
MSSKSFFVVYCVPTKIHLYHYHEPMLIRVDSFEHSISIKSSSSRFSAPGTGLLDHVLLCESLDGIEKRALLQHQMARSSTTVRLRKHIHTIRHAEYPQYASRLESSSVFDQTNVPTFLVVVVTGIIESHTSKIPVSLLPACTQTDREAGRGIDRDYRRRIILSMSFRNVLTKETTRQVHILSVEKRGVQRQQPQRVFEDYKT